MSLSNWLNSEVDTVCLHEGKERKLEEPGGQKLPFLTLQNFLAYKDPKQAEPLFRELRQIMQQVANDCDVKWFGDIAYNYAPFVKVIPTVFPEAKLVVIVRDGRSFVRSVITNEVPDPTPVGWLDPERPMSQTERFIALGRLRPVIGHDVYEHWSQFDLVQKNAWLWAETYRVIMDGLESWSPDQYLVARFEELFADVDKGYDKIRRFIGLDHPISDVTHGLLHTRINHRETRILPHFDDWSNVQKDGFWEQATPMMKRLGYL